MFSPKERLSIVLNEANKVLAQKPSTTTPTTANSNNRLSVSPPPALPDYTPLIDPELATYMPYEKDDIWVLKQQALLANLNLKSTRSASKPPDVLVEHLTSESEDLLRRELKSHFEKLRMRDTHQLEEKTFTDALKIATDEIKNLQDTVTELNNTLYRQRTGYRKTIDKIQALMRQRESELQTNFAMWQEDTQLTGGLMKGDKQQDDVVVLVDVHAVQTEHPAAILLQSVGTQCVQQQRSEVSSNIGTQTSPPPSCGDGSSQTMLPSVAYVSTQTTTESVRDVVEVTAVESAKQLTMITQAVVDTQPVKNNNTHSTYTQSDPDPLIEKCNQYEKLHASIMNRWSQMEQLKCELQKQFNQEEAINVTHPTRKYIDDSVIEDEIKDRHYRKRMYTLLQQGSSSAHVDHEKEEMKYTLDSLQYKCHRLQELLTTANNMIHAKEQEREQCKQDVKRLRIENQSLIESNATTRAEFQGQLDSLFVEHEMALRKCDRAVSSGHTWIVVAVGCLARNSHDAMLRTYWCKWNSRVGMSLRSQKNDMLHKNLWLQDKVNALEEMCRVGDRRLRQLNAAVVLWPQRITLMEAYVHWRHWSQCLSFERKFYGFVAKKDKLQSIAELALQEKHTSESRCSSMEKKLQEMLESNRELLEVCDQGQQEIARLRHDIKSLKAAAFEQALLFDEQVQALQQLLSFHEQVNGPANHNVLKLKEYISTAASAVLPKIAAEEEDYGPSSAASVSLGNQQHHEFDELRLASAHHAVATRAAFVHDVVDLHRLVQKHIRFCEQHGVRDVTYLDTLKSTVTGFHRDLRFLVEKHLTDREKQHYGLALGLEEKKTMAHIEGRLQQLILEHSPSRRLRNSSSRNDTTTPRRGVMTPR